jgi:biotin carboxyl carrier protein
VRYDVDVNGEVRQVTVVRRDGAFVVSTGHAEWVVDAEHVGGHMLSLLIQPGRTAPGAGPDPIQSREFSVVSDPLTGQFVLGLGPVPLSVGLNSGRRWGRKDEAGHGGSGPQRLVAPMPGKIVRVLAAPGARVVHRQPLVVIEAMKMENELRASRDGTLSEVLVREGQSVEAGALLAIITPA